MFERPMWPLQWGPEEVAVTGHTQKTDGKQQTPGSVNGHRRGRKGGSAASRAGRWKHIYSAIDLGTNNCRLLVARPAEHGFKVIDGYSRIVRLGEGVSRRGALSEEAMDRTIVALKICAEKMSRCNVSRHRSIATEACRRASNGSQFLNRVKKETGLELEIIKPAEEARLAVAGCTSLLEPTTGHALVFDIGGGSTELIWLGLKTGAHPEILAWKSIPCGVVTLSEKYGGTNVCNWTYQAMIDEVCDGLREFEEAHDISGNSRDAGMQLIGTSGTVTTLAGIHLGLERYDRSKVDGIWLKQEHVLSVSDRLSEMSYEERVRQPCVGRDRADLVIAGCAVVEAITRTWPAKRVRVADRGLREGMLMALIREADHEGRTASHASS